MQEKMNTGWGKYVSIGGICLALIFTSVLIYRNYYQTQVLASHSPQQEAMIKTEIQQEKLEQSPEEKVSSNITYQPLQPDQEPDDPLKEPTGHPESSPSDSQAEAHLEQELSIIAPDEAPKVDIPPVAHESEVAKQDSQDTSSKPKPLPKPNLVAMEPKLPTVENPIVSQKPTQIARKPVAIDIIIEESPSQVENKEEKTQSTVTDPASSTDIDIAAKVQVENKEAVNTSSNIQTTTVESQTNSSTLEVDSASTNMNIQSGLPIRQKITYKKSKKTRSFVSDGKAILVSASCKNKKEQTQKVQLYQIDGDQKTKVDEKKVACFKGDEKENKTVTFGKDLFEKKTRYQVIFRGTSDPVTSEVQVTIREKPTKKAKPKK